jgi:2-polyprenyl-6-methoxyphenol hydroxylase-like FAD-dependent oxidoreductase
MTNKEVYPESALVVGGGIGGLATSIALRRSGTNVRLVERAPEFGEIGAGLQLGPNATRILDEWGLLERALEVGVSVKNLILRDTATGHELTRLALDSTFSAGTAARTLSFIAPTSTPSCSMLPRMRELNY